MSDRRRERERERDRDRRSTTGPFGTMLGATFGPVGAAVGSVVDETRVAFTFSFGTDVGRSRDDEGDDADDAATIEIEDTGDDADDADDGLVEDGTATENGENGGAEAGTDGEDAA